MTRAEVNAIKARMLDQIMNDTEDGFNPENLGKLLSIQIYTVELLNEVMEEQAEQAKKAGY